MTILFVYRTYRKRPFFSSDRNHLHFRLIDKGLTAWQVDMIFYSVTITLGITSLYMSGRGKLVTFGLLVAVFLILWFLLLRVVNYRNEEIDTDDI
jgi:hypothetical protein